MKTQQLSRGISAVTTALSIAEAISEFKLHQRASRHTSATLRHYEYTLGKFGDWLKEYGAESVTDLQPKVIRAFMLDLDNSSLSPMSILGVMRGVRALCRFLESEEIIDRNPMERISMPKVDKRILPAFTPAEVSKLLAACDGKDLLSKRNLALVLVLLDSGLRLQEVASLKVESIDRESGVMRVIGKGRKERMTRIGAKSLKALNRYLRNREAHPGEPLWVGIRGQMTSWGIAETLEKIGKRAGVHAHPHKFRRTCAVMLLRNGADVFSVQNLLGHSDLTVLRRYLAQTDEDIQNAHAANSPVDRMSSRDSSCPGSTRAESYAR